MRETYGEKACAITGVGMSEISRATDKSALTLTLDACLEAIADAGLKRSDIDGLSTYPGQDNNASGFSPVGAPMLQDALRLKVDWYSGGGETPGQLGAVFNAIGAISAGLARHVLVFRTVYEGNARRLNRSANALVKGGARQFGAMSSATPYFALSATVHQATIFQRYLHQYPIRPEQVGRIAVNARRNAALNPKAVYKDPITIDDYLASEMLATPVRLLDCDVPVNGAAALVISHLNAAKDLRNRPVRFEAIGSAQRDRNNWDEIEGFATQTTSAAEMMWGRTELKPADVDVAELYDGFTFHTVTFLETMGFCRRGEAGDFIGDGSRIALEGELPIATGGGQLSAGRMHAYGHLHEACVQLWARGEARQVKGNPQVAAACTAGGPLSGVLLLVRD